ncbi:MAG TPA: monofunctional biosynthetic peptidoglycan transglycosylase [Thermoanaerobaculia bacterium]|nr:monofunctional biosynthetic peptidoglycan transglycosylase [Thermoanaerobaculia bacterium]
MIKRALLIALVVLLLFAAWQWLTFPDVSRLAEESPETTAFIEQRKKELRSDGKDDTIDYRWVSYERISPYLRRAVIVSEDNAFYEHEGVDTAEMKRILQESWNEGRLTRGGSTITQQLAKNLYLSSSRNPWRKVKEFLIARSMEKHLSKKRILEIYLNVIELGERTYGAEAAARHYFGRTAAGLSMSQAALLAGALPNPREMNPGDPGPRLRGRQQIILARMKRWGFAAEQEFVKQETVPEEKEVEPSPPLETAETGTASETEPETSPTETGEPPPIEPVPTETIEPVPPETAPPPPPDDGGVD